MCRRCAGRWSRAASPARWSSCGPGGGTFSWAILLPLGLVLTNACFQVLTSKLARTENPLTMHFYTGWVGTLIASCAAALRLDRAAARWQWWACCC